MRIWHKDLVRNLPNKQLLGQWRELCLIARNIHEKGTPNHLLVNRVMDYPLGHLVLYSYLVRDEMIERGWNPDYNRFEQWIPEEVFDDARNYTLKDVFSDWHDRNYYHICFYNLMEKHNCGGISDIEWRRIVNSVSDIS